MGILNLMKSLWLEQLKLRGIISKTKKLFKLSLICSCLLTNNVNIMSKLSKELVEKIRNYYNEGYSCQKTANKFGVGKTTVRSYVNIRPRKKN